MLSCLLYQKQMLCSRNATCIAAHRSPIHQACKNHHLQTHQTGGWQQIKMPCAPGVVMMVTVRCSSFASLMSRTTCAGFRRAISPSCSEHLLAALSAVHLTSLQTSRKLGTAPGSSSKQGTQLARRGCTVASMSASVGADTGTTYPS